MKKVFSTLIIFSLFCFIFADKVLAKVIVQEKGTVNIAKEEVVDDDLFIGAETVNIEGTVNGDVFIGAQTIKESGVINGNLHLGAGTVLISGKILGNVYVGGGSVVLREAVISGSLICGSGNLSIDEKSSIGKSLISGSGTVNNYAPIGRNVFIGAGSIFLSSKIGGEVKVGGGKINIGPNADIGKDFTYMIDDSSNFDLSNKATISGEIKKIESKTIPDKKIKENISNIAFPAKIAVTIFSFLGALIVGFILIKLFPKPILAISEQIKSSFFPNLGIGFLVLVLTFPALFLIMLTGVGLPLAGISFSFLMINLYFAKLAIGIGIGILISDKFEWKKISLYGKFTIGLLITYLAMKMPFVGWIFSLLITFSGLGALLIYYKNLLKTK